MVAGGVNPNREVSSLKTCMISAVLNSNVMLAPFRHNNQAIQKTGFPGREPGAGDNGRDIGKRHFYELTAAPRCGIVFIDSNAFLARSIAFSLGGPGRRFLSHGYAPALTASAMASSITRKIERLGHNKRRLGSLTGLIPR
jgi:hypothetical protein